MTDSATVYHWLQKRAYEWTTWVANWVSFIAEVQEQHGIVWRRCPGTLNAADIVSRGASIDSLLEGLWFTGLTWLRCMNEWPIQTIPAIDRWSNSNFQTFIIVREYFVDNRWWERFSTWKRTVGVGANLFLLEVPQYRVTDRVGGKKRKTDFRIIQAELFSQKVTLPQRKKFLLQDCSSLTHFWMNGEFCAVVLQIISWISFKRKNPIILGKHPLTDRLVEHYHVERMHPGMAALYAFLCTRFWLISGKRILQCIKNSTVHQE